MSVYGVLQMDRKITFGVVVSTRVLFPASLAVDGRKQILEKLEKLGYDYVITPEKSTPNGAIETYSDAQKCAKKSPMYCFWFMAIKMPYLNILRPVWHWYINLI